MDRQISIPDLPGYVSFRAGHRLQSRKILTGDEAKSTFDAIPSIDASQIFSEDFQERKRLAEQIGTAAQDVGFFYLINPPVSGAKMGTYRIRVLVMASSQDSRTELIYSSRCRFCSVSKILCPPRGCQGDPLCLS